MIKRNDVVANFFNKIRLSDGCWEWTAATSKGYGHLSVKGRRMRAHRFAWMLSHGLMLTGLRVLHKCDNRPCVRPSHLYLGTDADNARDAVVRGRNANARKTHCPHGHPYSGENLARTTRGRRCRACAGRREAEHVQSI